MKNRHYNSVWYLNWYGSHVKLLYLILNLTRESRLDLITNKMIYRVVLWFKFIPLSPSPLLLLLLLLYSVIFSRFISWYVKGYVTE